VDPKFRVPFSPQKPLEEIRTGAGLISEGATDLVQTRFITVTESPAVLGSGTRVPDFYSVRRGDALNIVPFILGDSKLVLIRKIKTASGIAYFGFPGGMMRGEDPVAHALAELREESGLEARDPVPLGFVNREPESSTDLDYFWFATVKDISGLRNDEEEGITTETVSVADAIKYAMSQYFDPFHATALWRALPIIATHMGIGSLLPHFRVALEDTMEALKL